MLTLQRESMQKLVTFKLELFSAYIIISAFLICKVVITEYLTCVATDGFMGMETQPVFIGIGPSPLNFQDCCCQDTKSSGCIDFSSPWEPTMKYLLILHFPQQIFRVANTCLILKIP